MKDEEELDPHDVDHGRAMALVARSRAYIDTVSHVEPRFSRKRKRQAAALLVLVIPILAALVNAWQ